MGMALSVKAAFPQTKKLVAMSILMAIDVVTNSNLFNAIIYYHHRGQEMLKRKIAQK